MAKAKKAAKKAAPKKAAPKKAAAKPREEKQVITIEKNGQKFKVYDMGVTLDKRNGAKYNRYKTVDDGTILHVKIAGSGTKKAAPKKAAPAKKAAPVKKAPPAKKAAAAEEPAADGEI